MEERDAIEGKREKLAREVRKAAREVQLLEYEAAAAGLSRMLRKEHLASFTR